MDKRVKSAIARIDAEHRGQTARGTGFLVGKDLVLTALHVVGDRRSDPPEPFDGPIRLTFRDHEPVLGEVVRESMDRFADWVLVRCEAPAGLEPIPIWTSPPPGARWENWGYPDSNPEGLAQSGHIEDDDVRLNGAHACQLFSKQAAAGRGARPRGWSGSPVIIDDHVVGHLRFALMEEGCAVAGTLYSCPISLVVEKYADLLPPVVSTASLAPAETAVRVSDYLLELEEGQYHALVLHRRADAPWTRELVARLEGAGLRVLALARGDAPGADDTLEEQLARCRTALVVASDAWRATPLWRTESEAILGRALRTDAFSAGLVQIAADAVPEMWQLAPCFDFSGADGPVGPEFDRLQFALAGREPPRADSPAHQVFREETAEAGRLLQAVRDAAADGPQGVLALWRSWQESDRPDDLVALIVAEALVSKAQPVQALEVLASARDGVRATQLRALALSDASRVEEAIALLEKLRAAGALDGESGGILGGRYKRMWQSSGDRKYLEKAFRVYAESFDRTNEHYPGINAAAMALRLGEVEESRRIAERVRGVMPEVDHWALATQAEVQLLLGDLDGARAGYASATARIPGDDRSIASMRRQARETLVAQGLPRDALDSAFPIARPALFSGHMVDAPGRAVPRFPPDRVDAVRAAIRRCLDAEDVRYGFCSAAGGGDLLFLEELLDRGGSAEVVLPFPAADFVKTSVGPDWQAAFERVLALPGRVQVRVLLDAVPPEAEQPAAYARCNDELAAAAAARAQLVDEEPLMVALWDGAAAGDGEGGTASAVATWQAAGRRVAQVAVPSA